MQKEKYIDNWELPKNIRTKSQTNIKTNLKNIQDKNLEN